MHTTGNLLALSPAGLKACRRLRVMCRNLYGGMEVGKWGSLEDSPHQAVSNVYDPSFWFPAVNVSEVAIPVDDLAQLPEELRRLPEADVRRRQSCLAEAQPLFRYR